jgi:hypothetical protein
MDSRKGKDDRECGWWFDRKEKSSQTHNSTRTEFSRLLDEMVEKEGREEYHGIVDGYGDDMCEVQTCRLGNKGRDDH